MEKRWVSSRDIQNKNIINRGNKKMVIQGKAMWCSVQSPNDKFPPPVYCVDLYIDDTNAEMLRSQGIKVKEKEGKLYVKAKRNQFRKDGTLNTKPNCVDSNKNPFEDLVGNGSLVNLQVNIFDWEFAGKTGKSLDFVGLQVLELVTFSGTEDEFESANVSTPDVKDDQFDEEF